MPHNEWDMAMLPRANCEQCQYKLLGREEDGHCYMFAEAPGEYCGQFTQVKPKAKPLIKRVKT